MALRREGSASKLIPPLMSVVFLFIAWYNIFHMDEKLHDINQNRLYAAISYLWILCFVPMIWRRNSHFAMHHGRQGIVLLIIEFFGLLIKWFIPFFGYFISMLLGFLIAILVLFGIINALDGKYWHMPILGRYAKEIKI